MIAKLPVGEIILGHDNEPSLIKRIEPGICVLRWDSQGAVGKGLLVPV